MGGHAQGDVASRLGVERIGAIYRADRSGDPEAALRRAIGAANAAIIERAAADDAGDDDGLCPMGSTCVALALKGETAWVAHVGDSRGYLLRGGELRQLTRDHSYVQELIEMGLCAEADRERHPHRSVILRALGAKPEVEPDVTAVPLEPGDVFCLATDGLTALVPKEEWQPVLAESAADPAQAARRLVELANARGGHDNTTAVVVRVQKLPGKPGALRRLLTFASLLL
jgi:protein phosphatase